MPSLHAQEHNVTREMSLLRREIVEEKKRIQDLKKCETHLLPLTALILSIQSAPACYKLHYKGLNRHSLTSQGRRSLPLRR